MLVVEKRKPPPTASPPLARGDDEQPRALSRRRVVEIQPIYPNGGKVVWQWSVWDHMIQDFDRAKPNYGDPAAHPELIYMRGGPGGRGPTAFWNHANSINYNAQLDQITISARRQQRNLVP